MGSNKDNSLSWDDFAKLGNPENVPPEKEETLVTSDNAHFHSKVRVYLERKGRKGKTVTLVKGVEANDTRMASLGKELKISCGVGGGLEGLNIMLQGDQRKKVIDKLIKLGFTDVKNAGA